MYIRILFLFLGLSLVAAPSAAGEDKCGHIFEGVGKPVYVEPHTPVTELCRLGFILSYNHRTKVSDWVMERLSPEALAGPALRENSRFQTDPELAGLEQADLADYRGSGFDRGHLAPAADLKWAQAAMDESFYLSNIAPQVGIGFNRGIWAQLEAFTRAWAQARHDIIVITGPVFADFTPTIGTNRVVVPDGFYKLLYDPASHEAMAFYLPNEIIRDRGFADFQVTIFGVEALTGLDFFADMTPASELESTVRPHLP